MFKNLLPTKPVKGLWLLLPAYVPSMILLSVIRLQNVVPVHHLTRDPAAVMDASMYTGLLSNIGVLIWCSATAICFFSYVLLCNSQYEGIRRFFLYSGLITSILMLDDFFMLHEAVFPKILGLSEKAIFSIYALMLLVYVANFYKFILTNTSFMLLACAFAFMGLSVLIDIADFTFGDDYDGNIYEDGTKFLGIVGWFSYFSYTAYGLVSISLRAITKATTPVQAKKYVQRVKIKRPSVRPSF